MEITDNNRAIILSAKESPYFKQCIFILRENVVKEEDRLINEARNIAERYSKKCENSRALVKTRRKNGFKYGISVLAGGILGASLALAIIFA